MRAKNNKIGVDSKRYTLRVSKNGKVFVMEKSSEGYWIPLKFLRGVWEYKRG